MRSPPGDIASPSRRMVPRYAGTTPAIAAASERLARAVRAEHRKGPARLDGEADVERARALRRRRRRRCSTSSSSGDALMSSFPRYAAWTDGARRDLGGVPSAMTFPKSSTVTRSARPSTISTLCSTSTQCDAMVGAERAARHLGERVRLVARRVPKTVRRGAVPAGSVARARATSTRRPVPSGKRGGGHRCEAAAGRAARGSRRPRRPHPGTAGRPAPSASSSKRTRDVALCRCDRRPRGARAPSGSGNNSARWKVRASPSRARRCGDAGGHVGAVHQHRARRVGGASPDRTPKYVVLPAPFGPMRPTIDRSGTASDISSSAMSPPKRTVTASGREERRHEPTPFGADRDRRRLVEHRDLPRRPSLLAPALAVAPTVHDLVHRAAGSRASPIAPSPNSTVGSSSHAPRGARSPAAGRSA